MVTEDAKQHTVVFIDVGSTCIARGERGINTEMTTRVIKKFWAHCREEKIYN